MQVSSVCLCACVCASSSDFTCLLLASCDFEGEKFALSCLLHIPSAMRTNVIIWNPAQSSAAARPQLSHPTCSLAQAEVSGSGRRERQHASTAAHEGRHTGNPAGPAAVLLARGHAAEAGRTLRFTAAPKGILHTYKYTNIHTR